MLTILLVELIVGFAPTRLNETRARLYVGFTKAPTAAADDGSVAPANNEATAQNPLEGPKPQFQPPKGSSWRVFAIETEGSGPIAITEVEEVRQQNPPSTWAVFAQNRSAAPIAAFSLAAAIAAGDGTVKAIQPIPAIKNLKPNQVVRREIRVTSTVLTPTDRVVFFLFEMTGGAGEWRINDADLRALISSAARRLPVP